MYFFLVYGNNVCVVIVMAYIALFPRHRYVCLHHILDDVLES